MQILYNENKCFRNSNMDETHAYTAENGLL